MTHKLLAGITHAIVSVPLKTDAERSGVRASVEFCWGPGDETSIGNIQFKKIDGSSTWIVPHVKTVRDGKEVSSPVFKGELLEQLNQAAARALEQVRNVVGTPSWGTQYRVFGNASGDVKVETVQE